MQRVVFRDLKFYRFLKYHVFNELSKWLEIIKVFFVI